MKHFYGSVLRFLTSYVASCLFLALFFKPFGLCWLGLFRMNTEAVVHHSSLATTRQKREWCPVGVFNYLQTTASSFCFIHLSFLPTRLPQNPHSTESTPPRDAAVDAMHLMHAAAAALFTPAAHPNTCCCMFRTLDNYIHVVGVLTPRMCIIHVLPPHLKLSGNKQKVEVSAFQADDFK